VRARILGLNDSLPVRRGQAVVCLVCGEREAPWRDSLAALAVETDPGTPIVLVGCAGASVAAADELPALRSAPWLIDDGCDRAVTGVNRLLAAAPDGDVAFVWGGAQVGPGWLERMRAAAHCDSTVISASALCERAGALAVAPSCSADARASAARARRRAP